MIFDKERLQNWRENSLNYIRPKRFSFIHISVTVQYYLQLRNMVTLRLFLLLARTTQNGCTRVELSQKVFLCPMMLAPKSDLLHCLACHFRLCFYPLLFASSWFWFCSLDGDKLFLVAQAMKVAWPTWIQSSLQLQLLKKWIPESFSRSPSTFISSGFFIQNSPPSPLSVFYGVCYPVAIDRINTGRDRR